MVTWIRTSARAPVLALVLVSVFSLAARSLLLGQPCQSPCTTAGDHTLIFDEAYYVNAARVIAGIHPPAGAHYANSPLGTDPNAEHPQGVKLIMAGAIELFGDGPFAWRIGSLIMGSLAILGMFFMVRSAGAGRWAGVAAAALMAADNLLLVHGRIGTLDIYGVAGMVWAIGLYLRGRTVASGVVLAIATCFKEVSPYALLVLGLLELGRLVVARRERAAPGDWRVGPAFQRLAVTTFTTSGVFVGLLGLMGLIATPYADADAKLITGGPFAHIAHMISYAAGLTSPNGPQGIASYPWQWLLDLKPIIYLRINPSLPGQSFRGIHPVSAFIGMVSPPIMLLAIPALLVAVYRLARRRPAVATLEREPIGEQQLALVGAAWFIGTWLPFELQSAIDSRTSYLYYMVIVMPGIYAGVVYLLGLGRGRRWARWLTWAWAASVVAALVLMYPFVAAF